MSDNTTTLPSHVWVAVINHKHGHDVFAAASEDGIRKEIHEYVKEQWKSEMPDDMQIPADREEAISAYFDYLQEHSIYEYIDFCDRLELKP